MLFQCRAERADERHAAVLMSTPFRLDSAATARRQQAETKLDGDAAKAGTSDQWNPFQKVAPKLFGCSFGVEGLGVDGG
jgi:hypothetical protein